MIRNRPFYTARLFEDKQVIHTRIGKNASSSQHMMMWDNAPESMDSITVQSLTTKAQLGHGTNHYDIDIQANTTCDLHAFINKHFDGYKKSVFIREPMERFLSSLAQDCSNNDTVDVFNSFETKMEEFEKNPSWKNLYSITGVTTNIDNHAILQTDLCNFEVLPTDIVYFEVDNNLTSNYLHWLNKSDKSYHTDKESNWVNKSITNSKKKHIKKCLKHYTDDSNSNIVSWIKEAYSKDFDMYKKLKSLCYREGEKLGR